MAGEAARRSTSAAVPASDGSVPRVPHALRACMTQASHEEDEAAYTLPPNRPSSTGGDEAREGGDVVGAGPAAAAGEARPLGETARHPVRVALRLVALGKLPTRQVIGLAEVGIEAVRVRRGERREAR